MEQREVVGGFSELKKLLISRYSIDRDPSFVKLYFSKAEGKLLMHDYDDHQKVYALCLNIVERTVENTLTAKARKLVLVSLKYQLPEKFLNEGFQLSGFFRF